MKNFEFVSKKDLLSYLNKFDQSKFSTDIIYLFDKLESVYRLYNELDLRHLLSAYIDVVNNNNSLKFKYKYFDEIKKLITNIMKNVDLYNDICEYSDDECECKEAENIIDKTDIYINIYTHSDYEDIPNHSVYVYISLDNYPYFAMLSFNKLFDSLNIFISKEVLDFISKVIKSIDILNDSSDNIKFNNEITEQ